MSLFKRVNRGFSVADSQSKTKNLASALGIPALNTPLKTTLSPTDDRSKATVPETTGIFKKPTEPKYLNKDKSDSEHASSKVSLQITCALNNAVENMSKVSSCDHTFVPKIKTRD